MDCSAKNKNWPAWLPQRSIKRAPEINKYSKYSKINCDPKKVPENIEKRWDDDWWTKKTLQDVGQKCIAWLTCRSHPNIWPMMDQVPSIRSTLFRLYHRSTILSCWLFCGFPSSWAPLQSDDSVVKKVNEGRIHDYLLLAGPHSIHFLIERKPSILKTTSSYVIRHLIVKKTFHWF